MLGAGLGEARLDGRDLRRGAFPPLGPGGGFGRRSRRGGARQARSRGRAPGLRRALRRAGRDRRRRSVRVSASSASSAAEGARPSSASAAAARASCVSASVVVTRAWASARADAARGDAVELALGGGVAVAGGVGLALRRAPAAAGGVLGLPRRRHFRFGHGHRLPARIEVGAHDAQLRLDVGEAVAAGEAACRPGRRIGGDGEAVPAPQIALLRHQPLAGLELAGDARRRRRGRRRRSAPAAAPSRRAPR